MSEELPIYLDHNASTPVLPQVLEAMLPYFSQHFGNPSSQHAFGRAAKAAVELAREQVAGLIGASPDEIVFTSGGTESNNLAIFGASAARPYKHHLVTSSIEHPAVRVPCSRLVRDGARASILAVDESGRVSVSDAKAAINDNTLLVTVMLANNETGAVQPIEELGALAEGVGALLHVDASQALGKIPVHVGKLKASLLSIAGHKMYAPKGVGALFVKRGSMLTPRLLGATHERGMRPGTENVPAIVGLGKAAALLSENLEQEQERQKRLSQRLWDELSARVPGLRLNGPSLEQPRLPNTLSLRFPGVWGSRVLAETPQVAASTGAACHDGQESASSGILALGLSEQEARGTVRISLGRLTSEAEVVRAASALADGFARASALS